jgi:hypothetical protein
MINIEVYWPGASFLFMGLFIYIPSMLYFSEENNIGSLFFSDGSQIEFVES